MKSGASNYVNGYFSGYSEIWKSLASVGIQGFSVGAEGGIRTPARFYPPTPLAGEPLIATWVLLHGYS